MDDSRIPKQLLYGELCVGKRHRGRPKLRYKDVLKQSLNDCDIDPKEWENLAKDRPAWRLKVHHGVHQYESVRIEEAKEKRSRRKAAASTDMRMFRQQPLLLFQTLYLFLLSPVPTVKRSL